MHTDTHLYVNNFSEYVKLLLWSRSILMKSGPKLRIYKYFLFILNRVIYIYSYKQLPTDL